jgi:hypothetical protein
VSHTYSALAYLTDESDFAVPAAAERLASRPSLSGVRMQVISERELHLLFDGWRLRIAVEDGDHVAEEAREAAEADPDYEGAARCRRRASIWSEDSDPDMDHFNDYVLTVEALARCFRGFHALDNAGAGWF